MAIAGSFSAAVTACVYSRAPDPTRPTVKGQKSWARSSPVPADAAQFAKPSQDRFVQLGPHGGGLASIRRRVLASSVSSAWSLRQMLSQRLHSLACHPHVIGKREVGTLASGVD
jgi:hypothetical protein